MNNENNEKEIENKINCINKKLSGMPKLKFENSLELESLKETMKEIQNKSKNIYMSSFTKLSLLSEELQVKLIPLVESVNKFVSTIDELFPNMPSEYIVDAIKLRLVSNTFLKNEKVVKIFKENTIFPPISYLSDEPMINFDIITNWYKWSTSNEIKEFYLDIIPMWKEKYENQEIFNFIDEISFNFLNDNYYSVTLLIYVLIESLLGIKIINGKNRVSYDTVKNIIHKEVFEKIEQEELYQKFIVENLYQQTEKAEEFSRHSVHGSEVNMKLFNKKVAYNMVFIYDLIQYVLTLKAYDSK